MSPWRVHVLVNDIAGCGLTPEHGLAMLVTTPVGTVLFDTGQSDRLPAAAVSLGLDLERLDGIALSHGHYDHTGGLPAVSVRLPDLPIWLHPEALTPKYARMEVPPHREIGMAATTVKQLKTNPRVMLRTTPQEVLPGIWLTGEIPRETGEDVGGPFYKDRECQVPDPMPDDQALVLQTSAGAVVLLGCAHAGVINTLNHVAAWFPDVPIHAVIGGMHLLRATPERLEATARALQVRGVQLVAPMHCSGTPAQDFLSTRLGSRCVPGIGGSIFEFP